MSPLEMLVSVGSTKLPKTGDGTFNDAELEVDLPEEGSFWDEAVAQLDVTIEPEMVDAEISAPHPQTSMVQPLHNLEIEQIAVAVGDAPIKNTMGSIDAETAPVAAVSDAENALLEGDVSSTASEANKSAAVVDEIVVEDEISRPVTENTAQIKPSDNMSLLASTSSSQPNDNAVVAGTRVKEMSETAALPVRSEIRQEPQKKIDAPIISDAKPEKIETRSVHAEISSAIGVPGEKWRANSTDVAQAPRTTSIATATNILPEVQDLTQVKAPVLETQEPLFPAELDQVELKDGTRIRELGRIAGIPQVPFSAKAIANQISLIARIGGEGALELQLNPQHLGKLSINIVETEFAHSVSVLAERSETLELLKKNEALLERELQAAGFSNLQFNFTQSDGSEPGQGNSNNKSFSLGETGKPTQLSSLSAELPRQMVELERLDIRL